MENNIIYRQDAINAMLKDKVPKGILFITDTAERDFEVFNNTCDRHAKIIEELPPAQLELKWIPCKERIPTEGEPFYVLCCDKYGGIMIGHVSACNDGKTPYLAENEYEYMYDCIAWMPLPTPCREGRQDEAAQ